MNPQKRTLQNLIMLMGLFFLGLFLNYVSSRNIFMLHGISSLYFLILSIVLTLYFSSRIIDRPMRPLLIAIGLLICLWTFMRACRYMIFLDAEQISRYCWYCYYVSMLFIPQLNFQAALSLGRKKEDPLPGICILSGIVTVIFILLVLTNDYHRLIFDFNPDYDQWNDNHTHELMYWVMTCWHYVFFAISIRILSAKSRLSASRRLGWLPVAYGVFFAVFLVIELLHLQDNWFDFGNFSFTEPACFLCGGFLILSISTGLIPSNKGYSQILSASSIPAVIMDKDDRIVYRSYTADRLQKDLQGILPPDEDFLTFSHPVSGGTAYWQMDVSRINILNKELEEVRDALSEESDLIAMRNSLGKRRASIEEKNRVYDAIAARVQHQSFTIRELSDKAIKQPDQADGFMRIICIYLAYIKRMSNLMLQSSISEEMERNELQLALGESARYLEKAGIPAAVISDELDPVCPSERLTDVYEQFQSILEQALPGLKGVTARLEKDWLKLIIEGVSEPLDIPADAGAEYEDGILYVSIPLGQDVKA